MESTMNAYAHRSSCCVLIYQQHVHYYLAVKLYANMELHMPMRRHMFWVIPKRYF